LKLLYNDLSHSFEFTTLEQQLSLRFQGDGIGHVKIKGEARDEPGNGNVLLFELFTDQTELPGLINQVSDVIEQYPFQ
jgi:hypothetical protein